MRPGTNAPTRIARAAAIVCVWTLATFVLLACLFAGLLGRGEWGDGEGDKLGRLELGALAVAAIAALVAAWWLTALIRGRSGPRRDAR